MQILQFAVCKRLLVLKPERRNRGYVTESASNEEGDSKVVHAPHFTGSSHARYVIFGRVIPKGVAEVYASQFFTLIVNV